MTPTELDRLTLFTAAELARRHRAQGLRLSHPEAVALISHEVRMAARRGAPHADLVEYGRSLLTVDDVEPGVENRIPFVRIEAALAEGGGVVTVWDPIRPGRGARASGPATSGSGAGEGRKRTALDVLNTSERTVHVRSHSHFFEVNRALKFDRASAFGLRLDRPPGAGVRFEPGEITRVELVAIDGPVDMRRPPRLAQAPLRGGGP